MKIEWNKVTSISQIVALILFVAVFYIGFFIGRPFGARSVTGDPVIKADYVCDAGKNLNVEFYENFIKLKFDNESVYLQRTISASGIRFANGDETLVFWGKGDGAFIEKNGEMYIKNCSVILEKRD